MVPALEPVVSLVNVVAAGEGVVEVGGDHGPLGGTSEEKRTKVGFDEDPSDGAQHSAACGCRRWHATPGRRLRSRDSDSLASSCSEFFFKEIHPVRSRIEVSMMGRKVKIMSRPISY